MPLKIGTVYVDVKVNAGNKKNDTPLPNDSLADP